MNDNDAGSPSLPPGSGDDDTPDGGSGGEPLLRPAPAAAETDQAVMTAAEQMTEMNLPMVQTAVLPDTASNAYHWLMLGLLLLISGSGLYLYQRKRRKLQI